MAKVLNIPVSKIRPQVRKLTLDQLNQIAKIFIAEYQLDKEDYPPKGASKDAKLLAKWILDTDEEALEDVLLTFERKTGFLFDTGIKRLPGSLKKVSARKAKAQAPVNTIKLPYSILPSPILSCLVQFTDPKTKKQSLGVVIGGTSSDMLVWSSFNDTGAIPWKQPGLTFYSLRIPYTKVEKRALLTDLGREWFTAKFSDTGADRSVPEYNDWVRGKLSVGKVVTITEDGWSINVRIEAINGNMLTVVNRDGQHRNVPLSVVSSIPVQTKRRAK